MNAQLKNRPHTVTREVRVLYQALRPLGPLAVAVFSVVRCGTILRAPAQEESFALKTGVLEAREARNISMSIPTGRDFLEIEQEQKEIRPHV